MKSSVINWLRNELAYFDNERTEAQQAFENYTEALKRFKAHKTLPKDIRWRFNWCMTDRKAVQRAKAKATTSLKRRKPK